MDLRQLRSFLVLGEELNFHRTARRLHLSQPALSRQIRQLEEEMGCRLLDRDRKRVELTAAGAYLLSRGRDLIESADRLTNELRQGWKPEGQTLSFGYTEAAMAGFLPDLLRRCRKQFPTLNLRLRSGHSDLLEREVISHLLDVAVISLPSNQPELVCREVAAEKLGVVLPDDHPLAGNKTIALSKLSDEAFILFPYKDNPHLFSDILEACRRAEFTPRQVEEVDSRMLAVNLVMAGQGITLLSEKLAPFCPGGVVFRPLIRPSSLIHYYFVCPKKNPHPLVRQILDLTR